MTRDLGSVLDLLSPGMRVFMPGGAAEPTAFLKVLAATPERASGVTFVGTWLPTINQTDVSGLAPASKSVGFFLPESFRASFEAGRFTHLPLDYTEIYRYLGRGAEIDLAIATVAPPAGGKVSLGISQDFLPAVLPTRARFVGLANPEMPAVRDGLAVDIDRLEQLIEVDEPLFTIQSAGPGAAGAAIGHHVAGLVDDGDTFEIGIGRLVPAVLAALRGHRDLAVHTGLVLDSLMDLADSGAISQGITTGVAVGNADMARRVARHDRIRFRPVDFTHSSATLAAIPNFVAINFVLEVDLFGQVNAEHVGGRFVSGRGGLADFARGARLSPGGRSIMVLNATAGRDKVSRIVPVLGSRPVTLTRYETDFVVTEHGVADLRRVSADARAERLIAVADPSARAGLTEAWGRLRAGF